ncbi:MAG: TerB family tellurite resistance protein [Amylibacter sp.]|nr:TerB family tellurite resistance protein [Amylibacter sp.]
MIKDILNAFMAKKAPPLTPDDARIALAALMVRLARTDGDYAQVEISTIDRVLQKRFDLDDAATKALRVKAEELETQAPDTVRFTRAIKETVPYEERAAVLQALWAVVLSDGHRDDDEHGLMRLVSNLLGINDRDSAFARQRAAKE